MLLLGVDVGIKVGLARLDGGLDGLERVPALGHVTLDLPRKLDIVRDVQVDLEVEQVTHALIVKGVQALDDQNLRRVCAPMLLVGVCTPWAP